VKRARTTALTTEPPARKKLVRCWLEESNSLRPRAKWTKVFNETPSKRFLRMNMEFAP
jgi:hypothetical protein